MTRSAVDVVAMWVPANPIPAGAELNLNYRLHWLANEPYPSKLAPVWATRLGRGGPPGLPRPKGVRKFMVEFLGGPLRDLQSGVKPELVVSTSRGTFGPYQLIEAVPDEVAGHWRAQFDLVVDVSQSGRATRVSQVRRRNSHRDLDVPVPPVLDTGCGNSCDRSPPSDGSTERLREGQFNQRASSWRANENK